MRDGKKSILKKLVEMVNMHIISGFHLFIHFPQKIAAVFVVVLFETYARKYLINVAAHGKARG